MFFTLMLFFLFLALQFVCYLYDKFSSSPVSKELSLFFAIVNTIIYFFAFLWGLRITMLYLDEGVKNVLLIVFFYYFILPFILIKSYIIFFQKSNNTFTNKPKFTWAEKIILPFILVMSVFLSSLKSTPEVVENKDPDIDYNYASSIARYVDAGYLFYSNPSLLSKGEKGLNSVISNDGLKFKDGVAQNKYILSFSKDNKSFTVLTKSTLSKKEGVKVSIDHNHNISYQKITDNQEFFIQPNMSFERISFKVADKKNNLCSNKSKEKSNTPLTHFVFEEINGGISVKEYIGDNPIVHVPCYVNEKPVIAIDEYAFNNKGIERVYIASTVQTIGEMAFANNDIDYIDLHDGLTRIGKAAFMNNHIKTLLIPSSVKEVEDSAFYNNGIQFLFFNNGVEKIDIKAFGQNSIFDLVLPHSLKEIGEESFAENPIETLYLFENISSIKDESLFDSHISVEIPNNNPHYSNTSGFLEEK